MAWYQGTRALSGRKHHLPDRGETGNAAGTQVFSLGELARTVQSSSYLGGDRYLIFTAKKDGFGPCKLTLSLLFGLWVFSFFPILGFFSPCSIISKREGERAVPFWVQKLQSLKLTAAPLDF